MRDTVVIEVINEVIDNINERLGGDEADSWVDTSTESYVKEVPVKVIDTGNGIKAFHKDTEVEGKFIKDDVHKVTMGQLLLEHWTEIKYSNPDGTEDVIKERMIIKGVEMPIQDNKHRLNTAVWKTKLHKLLLEEILNDYCFGTIMHMSEKRKAEAKTIRINKDVQAGINWYLPGEVMVVYYEVEEGVIVVKPTVPDGCLPVGLVAKGDYTVISDMSNDVEERMEKLGLELPQ